MSRKKTRYYYCYCHCCFFKKSAVSHLFLKAVLRQETIRFSPRGVLSKDSPEENTIDLIQVID